MRATRGIGVGILLALAGSGVASAADPGPGKVQVRNELGVAVGADIAGVDGLELAVERIKTGALARADATKPWSVVVGAGTYGDALINVPNIAVAPEPGAAVVVTGIGGADNTAKGCIDVTRGGVTIEAITCRGQAGNGIQASIPFSEAGVTLRNITVEQVTANAIEITGGQGALIVNPTITAAGNDGISFIRANGPGPYRVEGGLIRQSKNDGIDLHDDTRNVQIVGTTLEANTADGIRSEDAGNADLVVDQVHLNRNGNGLSFGGGALRQAITNSDVSGSVGNGIVLGAGTGIQVRNIRFDGSNVGGDLRFSNDSRAGGVYDGLTFIDTPMSLPGEPKGVVITGATAAQRATLLPVPANFVGLNRIVRVRDIDSKASSAVTLRYSFAPGELAATRTGSVQVYEDDRPANGNVWQLVPGTVVDPAGPVQVTLSDSQIASGSDTRFATYAPLGTVNQPPALRLISPGNGQVTAGRKVLVRVGVSDDEPLPAGQPVLTIDGRPVAGGKVGDGIGSWLTPAITLGQHSASVVVSDTRGLQAKADWVFTVVNGRPDAIVAGAVPAPGDTIVERPFTTIRVALRDDLPPKLLRLRMRVDGQRVKVTNRRGYAVARLVGLDRGNHRVIITVFDRAGLGKQRGWQFRVGKPIRSV